MTYKVILAGGREILVSQEDRDRLREEITAPFAPIAPRPAAPVYIAQQLNGPKGILIMAAHVVAIEEQ